MKHIEKGDAVIVEPKRVGDGRRLGEVVEVSGTSEHPRYRIRWEDGRESILYPGSDVTVRTPEPHEA
jgi:hypothetical protein